MVFQRFFKNKQDEVVKESVDTMRNWLAIIKQGRIVFQDPQRIEDEYFTNEAFKKSLELEEMIEADFDD